MSILVLFESAGILLDGAFSLLVFLITPDFLLCGKHDHMQENLKIEMDRII